MKVLINLSMAILCLFSFCIGQTTTSELRGLTLDVGTTHTFEFFDNGEYIGYNTYTVTKRETYNEVEAYFIESVTDLKTDLLTLHIDASYIIDVNGRCLHYEFSSTVNGEPQTMSADFTQESVHITGSASGKEYDKTITLMANTFSLDNNMIDQWDIALSAVVLEKGGKFSLFILAAQPMKTTMVRASIASETVKVQAAGKTWECLKLEFSVPAGLTIYVTETGQLIKMENESGLTVVLKE